MFVLTRLAVPLLLAANAALATPIKSRTPYAVKETFNVPSKWTRVSEAPADHLIVLQIGLKQSQFDELERHLYEVSDPDHERYGNHLSADEVNDLIKPHEDTSALVHDWLLEAGIELRELQYSPAKDWISVLLPVSKIEELLDTEYSVYQHIDGGYAVRTPSWSLPRHLHEHVSTIQPTNSFFRPTPRNSKVKVADGGNGPHQGWKHPITPQKFPTDPTVAQVCNTSLVTPECLRVYYETFDYTPKVPGKNKVGLCDYLNESNNRSDTHIFLEEYRPDAAQAAYEFEVVIIANGNNEQTPETPAELADGKDLEGNLDAETILGIDYPTPLTAYTTGGSPPYIPDAYTTSDTNEPYLTWLNYVLSHDDVPQIISTSYDDDEQTVPYSYATAVCNQMAQLGARGVSLLYASGDDGVGATGYCYSNDGKNTSTFLPEFPSTCPYITSVGATKDFSPEVVAWDPSNDFASGGGFSNYFPRPAYQDAAVTAYLSKILGSEYEGLYNRSGRAYPDISAQGQRYATIWDGSEVTLDGTSAATPCATAILSLVNDALIAAGKSPLGFLNPWLYKGGYKAFNDITSGSAIGCGVAGFPATVGWDPVSGWGTPMFKKIIAELGV